MATRSVPKMYRSEPSQRRPARRSTPARTRPAIDWGAKAAMLQRTLKERTANAPDIDHLRGKLPMSNAPLLSDVLDPSRNSFGVMRFLLAAAVLVSHAFYLYFGRVSSEPLFGVTGYTLGQHAVQVFFFLSGVLVTQSLAQSSSVRDYAIARALRIFPALAVCVLVTAYALGPWLSSLGGEAYLKDTSVLAYIAQTISLSTGSATLPGLFESNTVPGVVNTSLWTLKYEVLCYAVLGLIGAAAFLSGRVAAVVAAVSAVWFAAMLTLRPELVPGAELPAVLTYFSLFFGAGVVAYLLRDHIRLHGAIVVALGAFAAYALKSDFAEIAMAMFLGYGVLWLATFRFGGWRGFANTSDYSYGVYIYSMPVTQALIALRPELNLVSLIAASFGLTLVLAFLSWELIEKPALRLRHRLKRSPREESSSETAAVLATRAPRQTTADISRRPLPTRAAVPTDVSENLAAEAPVLPAVSGDRLRFATRKTATTPRLTEAERAELVERLKARSLAAAH